MLRFVFVRAGLAVLAGLAMLSTASAATLTWERDESAARCASNETLESQVEARLGRPLSALPSARGVHVRLERSGASWVIHLEMRDPSGKVQGERVLSVPGNECAKIEPYVALALALMIDPNAELGLGEEGTKDADAPESSASSPEAPTESPKADATVDTVPPPESREVPTRLSGQGHSVLYVYPAIVPVERERGWPREVAPELVARLTQSLLSGRFVQREVYTVVEPGQLLQQRSDGDALTRKAARRGSLVLQTGSKTVPPAHYVLAPSLDELTVQDGFDYSLGGSGRALAVNLRLHVFITDIARRRQLQGFDVKTGFSLLGRSKDAAAVRFAVKLALEKAADEVLDALRVEAAFRVRPRFVEASDGARAELLSLRGVKNGDRFEFEDANGERSGYATVHEVGATRARVDVWKSGRGRLVALGQAQRIVPSVALKSVHRLAYGEPSAEETERAASEGLMARHFGAGIELGMMWRFAWESASGSRIRPLVDVGWSFAAAHSLALNVEARAGLGYQLMPIPALGLGLLPYVTAGGLFMRGSMGSDDAGQPKLEGLLGVTANVGSTIEFFRLLGAVSLAATAEAQYVLPLLSASSRDDFLDHELPALHALSFQLGIVYRPSELSN
jgi:(2Fe-2S) ferredoxin